MDSEQHEDSKNSSEESSQLEQTSEYKGTGRSYECVFCKRGFTTAQALGGHMNIHRKDRSKNKPTSLPSVSIKDNDDNYYAMPSFLPSFPSYAPPLYSSTPSEAPYHQYHHQFSYNIYFPESAPYAKPNQHGFDESDLQSKYLEPYGKDDDWLTSLSLRVGMVNYGEENHGTRVCSDEDDLDLELRLGNKEGRFGDVMNRGTPVKVFSRQVYKALVSAPSL
ncbi:hypothetical protein RJ641_031332 [Dillenia turbinata]|uniref:C2H2-type domain-containing protein n=1 Tax=Dillenia turbinata TaxID=194707 RepID=A0AAN8VPV8_9MAGN